MESLPQLAFFSCYRPVKKEKEKEKSEKEKKKGGKRKGRERKRNSYSKGAQILFPEAQKCPARFVHILSN